jgi:hypothetical protein
MEDSPEDLPKPPRRTAARPFFSPRQNSGEGVSGPFELSRRRSAQLFTPPGSSPATPSADKAVAPVPKPLEQHASAPTSSAADGSTEMAADASTAETSSEIDFEGDWTPAPLIAPERTRDPESLRASTNLSDDDQLVVEQYEHKEIELTATVNEDPSEHFEVIAYDEANSLLKASAIDGENPQVDGLELESTEFSFEQAVKTPRMNVDSFWATEPFAAADAPPAADETEAMIDEETAGDAELAIEMSSTEHSIVSEPLEWTDDPSTTIAHAQAALEPEPEHDPGPPRARGPVLADIAPPWIGRATPVSSQALEELKESEPWDLTPSHGLEAITDELEASESAAESHAMLEPPAASAAPAGDGVADVLERLAARVRDGELDVQPDSHLSDEAALAAVLTALLRLRR